MLLREQIKNRIRHMAPCAPVQDVMQLQAYMQLLGVSQGCLVEDLHGLMRVTEVVRDDTLWSTYILPGLVSFCTDLYRHLQRCQ